MERKTLKFLRILIPGLILIFEFLPLMKSLEINFKIGEEWLSYSFLVIPALMFGAVYFIFDFRNLVTSPSHRKIDLNIITSLLKIYNIDLSQDDYNYLKDRRLKHIFYHFIDNDPSLTAKSQLVYFNGLLWTSTADLFLLSILSSIIFFSTGFFIFKSQEVWIFGVIYAGISLLSLGLHSLTILRHYKLSNDQIEFIETNFRNDLIDRINTVLNEKP